LVVEEEGKMSEVEMRWLKACETARRETSVSLSKRRVVRTRKEENQNERGER